MSALHRVVRGLRTRSGALADRVAVFYNRHLAPRPSVQLAYGVAKGLGDHLAGDMAASIAYYAILSVFPLLLGIIAVLGLFLPEETVQEQVLQFLGQYFPGSTNLIEENVREVIQARGTLGIVGIAGLIWSGSLIFGAVGRVINRAWGINQFRPFWIRKPRDLAMAVSTGLLFFLSIALSIISAILPRLGLPFEELLLTMVFRGAAFVLGLAAFSVLYKLMPNTRTHWRHIWPGAALAAVLFELARNGFVFYARNFTNWELVYGSISSVIAFLIWAFFSAYILIIGAEFSAEFGRMRHGITRDATIGTRNSSGSSNPES